MTDQRGNILWVDDEIHHLKPHILFLEEKGYNLTKVTNGQDAIALLNENNYDLILLDHSMPGMDGLETLKKIKTNQPNKIVILITKTEDEWLMNEAITSQVEQFLTKPVNPSQIFMACKQALEKIKLQEEKVTSDYLKEFQEINSILVNKLTINDWWMLYDRLVDWQIKFDTFRNTGLGSILDEQIQTCNKEFVQFVEDNYEKWMQGNNRPVLPNDVISKYVKPLLDEDKRVLLLVVDCMRYDHFKTLLPIFESLFRVKIHPAFSLLPTATPYSRNAIFSGIFPDEMISRYPKQKEDFKLDSSSLNQHEREFLIDNLKKLNLQHKSMHYHKIWAVNEGKKFLNRVKDFSKQDLLAMVVNFVDILAHKSSQMDVLREMVPNESGYRIAVKSWFENSWLFQVLKYLSEMGWSVVLTSDHGSIKVKNDTLVLANRDASSGIRYKYGRNINTNDKNALIIKDPERYRLPSLGPQPSYIIAKSENYFVYPNDAHKFQSKFKNSFQHGGISMEEMMIPIAVMEPDD